MTRLLTTEICSMTELREPQKVLDRAQGRPVAVLKNSKLVAYLVPADQVETPEHRVATMEELLAHLRETQTEVQPVLDYLRDK